MGDLRASLSPHLFCRRYSSFRSPNWVRISVRISSRWETVCASQVPANCAMYLQKLLELLRAVLRCVLGSCNLQLSVQIKCCGIHSFKIKIIEDSFRFREWLPLQTRPNCYSSGLTILLLIMNVWLSEENDGNA